VATLNVTWYKAAQGSGAPLRLRYSALPASTMHKDQAEREPEAQTPQASAQPSSEGSGERRQPARGPAGVRPLRRLSLYESTGPQLGLAEWYFDAKYPNAGFTMVILKGCSMNTTVAQKGVKNGFGALAKYTKGSYVPGRFGVTCCWMPLRILSSFASAYDTALNTPAVKTPLAPWVRLERATIWWMA
jgi:hypothetical protein